jgi:molybdenum cofactor cytidylyltransferase
MPISLLNALGISRENLRLAFVGAGGKTSAMFRVSRQLEGPVILTTTTHIGVDQAKFADENWIITESDEIIKILGRTREPSVILLTSGESEDGRLMPLSAKCQETLVKECISRDLPLLVEADGARGLPLKAPGEHEPAIPEWVNAVLLVAGMGGIGQPLDKLHVHRSEHFSNLSGLGFAEIITPRALARVLMHPEGGLKRIPVKARKLVLLNQAEGETRLGQAREIAEGLIPSFERVVIGSLLPEEERFEAEIEAVYCPVASIILAAGGSERMGQPKALITLNGETMVHLSARIAIQSGLSPVIIVAGDHLESIAEALADLNVQVVHNDDWKDGQSTSLRTGLSCIPDQVGAVIFQVVDQPGLSMALLLALVEAHRQTKAAIIQPQAAGSRANPVLFDCETFTALMNISGDRGGRAIFNQFKVQGLPWHDSRILIDLDSPEDLEKLKVFE